VRFPNGHAADMDIVDHPDSIGLVPIDDQGRIWFVRQYRHPPGEFLLELPAGTLAAGEDPGTCAVRECREEIGMSPGRLTALGDCYLAPGYSTECMHFYLAEDLAPAPLPPDADEVLQIERLTIDEVDERLRTGGLPDAKSVAGLHLALGRLRPPSAS
jgi:ADP-ribose pyrophosphatase